MQILFATQNPQKQKEVTEILSDKDISVAFPNEFDQIKDLDPEESGDSFEANALLKAQAFGQASGLVSVSDDSGLEVTALDGKPGIHSKRFAPGSDHDRNVKLLSFLKGKEDRSARFISVLCLFDPATNEHQFFEGVVMGKIAEKIQGSGGFGYDPLFIPDGYDQTFGELGSEIKNTMSHRRRSLIKLHTFLLEQTK